MEESCRESTTFFVTKLQLENGVKELKELFACGVTKPEVTQSVSYFIRIVGYFYICVY